MCTIIWGSTWIAITYQLGTVAPEASVAYRFALASALIAAGCLATGRSLRFPLRVHGQLVCQGMLFFGLNYIAIYRAEQYVASGLVAVLFSTMVIMSLVGTRDRLRHADHCAGARGCGARRGGIALLFLPELMAARAGGGAAIGIAFGLGATLLATGGNLVSMRMQRRHLPIVETTAWGMGYGALIAAIVARSAESTWTFDTRVGYIVSLATWRCSGASSRFSRI